MLPQNLWRYSWCRCLTAFAVYTATALIGAAIFYAIEGTDELERAYEYQVARDEQIAGIEQHLQSTADPKLVANFTALIREFERYADSKEMAPTPEALNWSFGGSLFFALTIMTTIGEWRHPRAPTPLPTNFSSLAPHFQPRALGHCPEGVVRERVRHGRLR
jgi:hypothetical protein